MTNPRKSGGITMDKAIARDLEKETGLDGSTDAPERLDDPHERGRQANERQVHQGAAGTRADTDADEGGGLTLQRLIDVLSRKRRPEAAARIVEGGPFRLPR